MCNVYIDAERSFKRIRCFEKYFLFNSVYHCKSPCTLHRLPLRLQHLTRCADKELVGCRVSSSQRNVDCNGNAQGGTRNYGDGGRSAATGTQVDEGCIYYYTSIMWKRKVTVVG